MANTLQGLDGLVFTGGIGEHASEIRRRICERLTRLGVSLDQEAISKTGKPLVRSAARSMCW